MPCKDDLTLYGQQTSYLCNHTHVCILLCMDLENFVHFGVGKLAQE